MTSCIDLVLETFPSIEQIQGDPAPGIKSVEAREASATSIYSFLWSADKLRRIRLCTLQTPKFSAETLVIYPKFGYDAPIFGSEFLNIGGKKFFAAIDFHPVSSDKDYAALYLNDFPDNQMSKSKFYNLSRFFSSKFWVRKSQDSSLYNEYIAMLKTYLLAYSECIEECQPSKSHYAYEQMEYNIHMATNDPARGILKAYFSEEFAEKYINDFLFEVKSARDFINCIC